MKRILHFITFLLCVGSFCFSFWFPEPTGEHFEVATVFLLWIAIAISNFLISQGIPGLLSRVFHIITFTLCLFAMLQFLFPLPFQEGIAPVVAKHYATDRSCNRSDPTPLNESCVWQGSTDAKYDMCYRTWSLSNLTAFDLSQLASLVYGQHDDHDNQLKQVFPGMDVSSTCAPYEKFPRHCTYTFTRDGGHKTHVVAYKGTSTPTDDLVDLAFFGVVKVIQWGGLFLPLFNLIGVDQIQWYVHWFHWPGTLEAEEQIWELAREPVLRLKQNSSRNDDVIVTGHSLGGGIAQVVAGTLYVPALVFSAPGVVYSAKRFGLLSRNRDMKDMIDTPLLNKVNDMKNRASMQWIMRQVSNVIPAFDVVPRVDLQQSIEQHVDCVLYNSHHQSGFTRPSQPQNPDFFKCHSISKTACEIWRVCGDSRGRDVTCMGENSVTGISLGRFFVPDINADL